MLYYTGVVVVSPYCIPTASLCAELAHVITHVTSSMQGSPTVANPKAETYRHALAVTTTRPGLDGKPYLYTLNMSCPQVRWPTALQGLEE
jgi:hypothetical protein